MITVYDGLMLLIVLVAVVQGAWRGMAWQVAPIASLIIGYIISYPMSPQLAPYFGKPPLNRLWAMITIYLLVSMAVYMVARSIRHSLEKMKLVEFDRHLGAILGGVKGVLFTVVLTLGLVTVSDQAREIILKSESSTIAARLMNTISPILPTQLNDLVAPYVKNLNDQLPEIADNPTFTLPRPPSLIPNRLSSQDNLSKPQRFDDNDPFGAPDMNPLPNDDFPTFPDSTNTKPRTPSLFEDEIVPAPIRPKTPSQRDPLPPTPPDDDFFFGADPDKALENSKSRIR
ncbi:hypothetical protein GC163_00765 [bacterium]|nr:hypothetical protein [bacterium]